MTELTIQPIVFRTTRRKVQRKPRTPMIPRSKTKRRATGRIRGFAEKVWSLKKADKHFSEFIRTRDGRCMHPIGCNRSTMLQNSHYIGRAIKSTRYDPDNCITLCWLHHYKDKLLGFEYQKQTQEKHGFDGAYTVFMKNYLGIERFEALKERSQLKIKQKVAIFNYQSKI